LANSPARDGVLFPASEGARINIDNFRSREWTPALLAPDVDHRRIYDIRHTFATWSLAAGMSMFTLARRMGTSVQMIVRTYGHPAQDAEDQDRYLLDAYGAASSGRGHDVGRMTELDEGADEDAA
jgi:integrase